MAYEASGFLLKANMHTSSQISYPGVSI